MTEKELVIKFDEEFDRDFCYDDSCENRACWECSTYKECFEQFREDLGYAPRITVGLDDD